MAKTKPSAKKTTPARTKTAAKKPAPKNAVANKTGNFPAVFARLRAILTPYAPAMVVVKDDQTWYYLDTKLIGRNKKPIMFGGVRLGKAYVSFYLMTVYCDPKFVAGMSPALRKRMQGKACFNFAEVDEALFAELETLTNAGAEWMTRENLDKLIGSK